MFAGARFPKAALLLPIAVAVCALMVLPGGTYLAGLQSSALHGSLEARGGSSLPTALVGPVATHSTLPGPVPASLANVPWISALSHHDAKLRPLTSLPNFALLQHPATSSGTVNPLYVSQPAPLGLADYGLGATPYSYNVSRLMGQVTLAAPPNMTDPASVGVIEPGGAADGFVGSFNEFGVQLNTVATNMSIPGSDQGFFWTQNVIDWNDTGIHFVDDTFNLTSATQAPFVIEPGTIYSACHTSGAGVSTILTVYGGVFQCVGGTVPISPASYPITVQLYNNATVNAQKRTQVSYGYRILEAGTGTLVTGISDIIVFNSPGAPSTPPANKPGFSIDAFSDAPAGLFRDAEMDLVGDIGGDNAVFRSISGSVELMYTNASHGGWASVPSAYNFGGDTGETSTG
ncbi:MAG TPA: thermopsin family protease, partial [Thermoplasmata archaeon]|nr:thermopsin family protease [Thermoplasmata archaeon]